MSQQKTLENEIELIKKTQENPKDFELLYDFYYLPIFRFISKRTLDKDTAFELTSIVFVKALENIKKYKPAGYPFSSWLYKIAYNATNDFYRKQKSSRVVDIDVNRLEELAEEEDVLKDEFRLEKVLKCIEELNENEISLLELRFFEQRDYAEISSILSITEANARKKVSRLIAKLKLMLNI